MYNGRLIKEQFYNNSKLRGKFTRVDIKVVGIKVVYARAVWETADGKDYFKQLILKDRFIIADFIQESKYRFELIVRIIVNKYSKDLFNYLSFLSLVIGLLSSTVQTFDLLLILDQSLESISKPNC